MLDADPAKSNDRVLIALASRIVQEVGESWRRARESKKRLATRSIDTVIRFKSPAECLAFTEDLARAVAHSSSAITTRQTRAVDPPPRRRVIFLVHRNQDLREKNHARKEGCCR
jgi:hypothetical protein